MPLTRFLRTSIILSWILLLLYLFTMDLHNYKVFSIVALTAGCISWGFTLFFLMKHGGAFDEQSFHRTRPMGDRIVFKRHCLIIASFCAFMMCAMIIRGIYYHLGVNSTLVGVLMIGLLSVFFSTTLSTGFSIYLAQSRRKHWSLTLMLYLPITTYLLIMGGVIPLPSSMYFSIVIGGLMVITHGLVAASICSMLAWFFVAKTRRWWTGVILILLAMLSLPLLVNPRMLYDRNNAFAQSQIPNGSLRMRTEIPKFELLSMKSGANFLACDGLEKNEYALINFIFDKNDPNFPDTLKEDGVNNFNRPFEHHIQFSVFNQYENVAATHTPALKMIQANFPHCTVDQRSYRQNHYEFGFNDIFLPGTESLYVEMFQNCKWTCRVQITQMNKLVSFPYQSGGESPLPEGGVIKVSASRLKEGNYYFFKKLVSPSVALQYTTEFDYYARNSIGYILLLVNSQETKAIAMEDNSVSTIEQFGMISSLHQHTINTVLLRDWTKEDIQGARVHVLKKSVRSIFQSDNTLLKVD
jgi:hypothetical protein